MQIVNNTPENGPKQDGSTRPVESRLVVYDSAKDYKLDQIDISGAYASTTNHMPLIQLAKAVANQVEKLVKIEDKIRDLMSESATKPDVPVGVDKIASLANELPWYKEYHAAEGKVNIQLAEKILENSGNKNKYLPIQIQLDKERKELAEVIINEVKQKLDPQGVPPGEKEIRQIFEFKEKITWYREFIKSGEKLDTKMIDRILTNDGKNYSKITAIDGKSLMFEGKSTVFFQKIPLLLNSRKNIALLLCGKYEAQEGGEIKNQVLFSDLEEAKRRLFGNGFEYCVKAHEFTTELKSHLKVVFADLEDQGKSDEIAKIKASLPILNDRSLPKDYHDAVRIHRNETSGYGDAVTILKGMRNEVSCLDARKSIDLALNTIKFNLSGPNSLNKLKTQCEQGELKLDFVSGGTHSRSQDMIIYLGKGLGKFGKLVADKLKSKILREREPVLAVADNADRDVPENKSASLVFLKKALGLYWRIGGAVTSDHRLKYKDPMFITSFVIENVITHRGDLKNLSTRHSRLSNAAATLPQLAFANTKKDDDFIRTCIVVGTVVSAITGSVYLPVIFGPTLLVGAYKFLRESRGGVRKEEIENMRKRILHPEKSADGSGKKDDGSAAQTPQSKSKPDEDGSGNGDGDGDGA